MRAAEPRLIAELACERLGLRPASAELIRLGTNALYRLRREGVVLRIGRSSDNWQTAEKEIRVGRWLERAGIAAVRAVDRVDQPLRVAGVPVTVWEWMPEDGVDPSPDELGAILRQLHEADADGLDVDQLDPLAPARRDLALAPPDLDPGLVAYLREEVARLGDAFAALRSSMPLGPVHGDAHTGNLVHSGGRAVLIDFETFAVGPREWDLVPTAVRHERFGLPTGAYVAFAVRYGFDVRSWSGYSVLRRIREVVVTSWLLPRAGEPAVATELRNRVATLTTLQSGVHWTAR